MFKGFRDKLSDVFEGFKTIRTRNAIIIIIINIAYTYGNSIQGSLRGLVATRELGLSATIVGTAISFSAIIQMLVRTPAGSVADNMRKKIKYFLAAGIILEIVDIFAFSLIHNIYGYYFVFFLDGVVDALVMTIIPVILAITIDRRAMGTAYAVMQGVTRIITSTARQLSITTYNQSDLVHALMIGILPLAAACILSFLLDSHAISENSVLFSGNRGKKKSGILFYLIPFCIASNMAQASINFDSQFMPLYSDEYGFKYLDLSTLGGSISGIIGIVVGFICDIIDPSVVLGVGIIGLAACYYGWSMVDNVTILRTSYFIAFFFRFITVVANIIGMKMVSNDKQGAFAATMGLCTSAMNIIASPLLGIGIDNLGYRNTLYCLVAWQVLAFIIYVFTYKDLKRRKELDI